MCRDVEEELKPKWEEENSYVGIEMWDEYWRSMRLKYGEEEQNSYVRVEMWNEYWRLNGMDYGDTKRKFREKCRELRVRTRMLRELEDKGWAEGWWHSCAKSGMFQRLYGVPESSEQWIANERHNRFVMESDDSESSVMIDNMTEISSGMEEEENEVCLDKLENRAYINNRELYQYETEDDWKDPEYWYGTTWYGKWMPKCCMEEVQRIVGKKWRKYKKNLR